MVLGILGGIALGRCEKTAWLFNVYRWLDLLNLREEKPKAHFEHEGPYYDIYEGGPWIRPDMENVPDYK